MPVPCRVRSVRVRCSGASASKAIRQLLFHLGWPPCDASPFAFIPSQSRCGCCSRNFATALVCRHYASRSLPVRCVIGLRFGLSQRYRTTRWRPYHPHKVFKKFEGALHRHRKNFPSSTACRQKQLRHSVNLHSQYDGTEAPTRHRWRRDHAQLGLTRIENDRHRLPGVDTACRAAWL